MSLISPKAEIFESIVGEGTEIREFTTIRNSLINPECKISERVSIKKCSVGRGCEINAGTYIEMAEIAFDVQIGPNCSIVGVTHEYTNAGIDHKDIFRPIKIDRGSWICAGCIILPGVIIGEKSIIAAGAIVNKNVPPKHIYFGTPSNCRIVPIEKGA